MNDPADFSFLDSTQARPTRVRYVVLGWLALAAVTSYLTRVCLAPAASTIQAELGLSDPQMGSILGGFFVGYIFGQVPGGWLGDRLGARLALALLSVLWSVFTVWSTWAAGAELFWWSRVAVGFAQGGLFPISAQVITAWFPLDRRGVASAVPTGFMSVGSVLASGLTVLFLPTLGWRVVFSLYAAAGLAWSIAFFGWYRNRPEEHPAVNSAECKLIRGSPPAAIAVWDDDPSGLVSQRPVAVVTTGQALRAMAASGSLWALNGQSYFRAFAYAFFVTWFPTYLQRSRGVEIAGAGYLTMLPLAGVVAGSLMGGSLVDAVLERTGSRWLSRCGLSAVALLLCGLATLGAAFVRDALTAVLVIAAGSASFGLTGPSTWAATMDIGRERTAVVFAIMNVAGNVGAITSPSVVGHLFDHLQRTGGDLALVLYLFAGTYFAAAVCWLLVDPNRCAVQSRTA